MWRWTAIGLATLVLAACAPLVQRPLPVAAGFSGPRLEPDAFISFDGARLGLQRWDPQGRAPWAVIIGVHGMNDYANAFDLAGPFWASDGVATVAYDQRGFGRSPGRGVWGGDDLMTEDLRTITTLVRQRYPDAIIAVAGESLGGSVAIEAFASDRPPLADRLVLISPAVWGWSSQPLPNKTLLWLAAHLDGGWVINPPKFVTRNRFASDNMEEMRRMGRDPLEMWGARADALYGLVSTMERAGRLLPKVKISVLYLAGAHDEVIPTAPTRLAARGLKPNDQSALYANGWHLLLIDKQAPAVYGDIESFLRDPGAPLPSGAPPISATEAR